MDEISQRNASRIGRVGMLLQTQEECAELIQAISKYNRALGLGQLTETSVDEASDHLVLELADVAVCIEQLAWLFGIEADVEHFKKTAVKRVAKRYGMEVPEEDEDE